MLTEVLLIALILLGLWVAVSRLAGRDKTLPPGPPGLPLVGALPPSGRSFEEHCLHQQRLYGDIFSMQIGSRLIIGLMRYDLIKDAFSRPQFSARPDIYTLQIFTRFSNTGLVFSNGKPWINGRRFALTHLKDLGMGRSVMEDSIQEEARALVQDFEKSLGKPIEISSNVNVAILNVIWKMVAGERYDVTNKDMQKLTHNIEENLKLILGPMSLLDWFPWLQYLPEFIKDKYFETGLARKNLDEVVDFLQIVIKKHQATLDPGNVRDYIDHYLVEMEAQKHDPHSTFRQDLLDLTISMLDLYGAGSETTSSTLRWLFLYMAVHPAVQERVQQELDQVVPAQRLPELQDRLPYFEAVLAETSRMISLTTFIVPHMTSEDTQLSGYHIPKDSIVMAYAKGVHYDPKLWDNPKEFQPERFLDENGQFVSKEFLIPFSTGRRQCLGESVARMELKLIGGAVLQQFRIAAPEGVTLNTEHDEPDYREGVLNFAKPYKVVLNKRI